MKLNLSSLFLIVLITFQFSLQITSNCFDAVNGIGACYRVYAYHQNCKEVFPTKCALNEWKVVTNFFRTNFNYEYVQNSYTYVFKTDYNFSISCGKLLSSNYIAYSV